MVFSLYKRFMAYNPSTDDTLFRMNPQQRVGHTISEVQKSQLKQRSSTAIFDKPCPV